MLRGLITRKHGSNESTREQPAMYAAKHRPLSRPITYKQRSELASQVVLNASPAIIVLTQAAEKTRTSLPPALLPASLTL